MFQILSVIIQHFHMFRKLKNLGFLLYYLEELKLLLQQFLLTLSLLRIYMKVLGFGQFLFSLMSLNGSKILTVLNMLLCLQSHKLFKIQDSYHRDLFLIYIVLIGDFRELAIQVSLSLILICKFL